MIGVDHYRATRIKGRYAEMLEPLFGQSEPVVNTEFGCCTYRGAEEAGDRAWGIIDVKTEFLHQIPLLGWFERRRLKSEHVRDEGLQACEVVDQLTVLDGAGVGGAFVMTFASPTNPYDDDPDTTSIWRATLW